MRLISPVKLIPVLIIASTLSALLLSFLFVCSDLVGRRGRSIDCRAQSSPLSGKALMPRTRIIGVEHFVRPTGPLLETEIWRRV
jgi:hypothetical protein